jgi:hypothetical protein
LQATDGLSFWCFGSYTSSQVDGSNRPKNSAGFSGQRQQTLFESFDVKSQSNQVNPTSPEDAPPVPPKPRSWHRMQIGEVWWSCHLCNFKICKVQGTYGHHDARREHISKKHSSQKDEFPKLSKQFTRKVSSEFYGRKWNHLLQTCSKYGWPGMHQLIRNKKQGWKCAKGSANRILSHEIPSQVCDQFQGNPKSIPSLETRQTLWNQWLDEAHKAARIDPKETSFKQKQARLQARVAKQNLWDAKVNPVTKAKRGRFQGLN